MANCLANSVYLDGQPDLCRNLPNAGKTAPGGPEHIPTASCRNLASLVAALRSGNCASSPLCNALASRKAAACAPYDAPAAGTSFCGAVAKMKTAYEARRPNPVKTVDPKLLLLVKSSQTVAMEAQAARVAVALKAQAANEQAAAKAAAIKKTAEEIAKSKFIAEEKRNRAEALRNKKQEPPQQFRKGQKIQKLPPDVQKRMDAISNKSQATQSAPAPGPGMPGPTTPTR
jgi:hypothetical protein